MSLPATFLRALKSYRDEVKNWNVKDNFNIASQITQRVAIDGDQHPSDKNTPPSDDFSHLTRKKTLCELILISCVVCGIEFCYAAETAFVSPTLLKIGIPVAYMTFVWGVSPALGFLMVPVLGSLSDRCSLRLGRRRPFIILMSVGIILGLLFVPNGKFIGILLGDKYCITMSSANSSTPYFQNYNSTITDSIEHHTLTNQTFVARYSRFEMAVSAVNQSFVHSYSNWTATTAPNFKCNVHNPWSIFFTILGVVLLDLNCDACQSPCRTYLLDVCLPEDHAKGLSIFTIMAGMGGSVGYLLGAFNWERTHFGQNLGGHERIVFTLVLVIYLLFVTLTVTSIKEMPLSKLGVRKENLQKPKKTKSHKKYRKFVNEESSSEEETPLGSKHQHGSGSDSIKLKNIDTKQHRYGSISDYTGHSGKSKNPQSNINQSSPDNTITIMEKPEASFENKSQTDSKNRTAATLSAENHGPIHLDVAKHCKVNPNELKPAELMASVDIDLLPADVSLKTYLLSIVHMPRSMLILCITNLFCWMSLVCYSLYFTDFVGQAVYGGDPRAPGELLFIKNGHLRRKII